MEVGIVGLGAMGAAIAERLLAMGIVVRVWNRSRERLPPLEALGAVSVGSVSELVNGCAKVLSCLSDAAAVVQVFEGVGLAGSQRPCLLVNTGTVGPQASRQLEAMMELRGFRYIEMPVSGGPEGARGGTLTAYLGRSGFEGADISSLVFKLAKRVVACTGNTEAQQIKVLNNLCEAVNLWGAAEAFALGRRIGLSEEQLHSGLPAGRGDSRYLGVLLDHVHRQPEHASVSLAIRCKDLDLAAALVPSGCAEPAQLALVRSLFQRSMADLGAEADQCRCLEWVQSVLDGGIRVGVATSNTR